ncbi:MAG: DUF7065 domain-containing protein [Candidatus Helarchaeota archaeon]
MSNIDRIRKFLEENKIQLDANYLKFLEYIGQDDSLILKNEDEYSHIYPEYLPNWSESWYFNFIDEKSGVDWVSRISYNPYEKGSNVLSVLFIDNKPRVYVNRLKIEEMPKNKWDLDKKVKYELVAPHTEWKLKFEDKLFDLEITWKNRFKPFSYLEGLDIVEYLKEYLDLIGKASQQHYEQAGVVSGTLKFKKTGEIRKINCFGHRDHSWGVREWKVVDKWNWIAVQFDDKTINVAKVCIGDKILVSGFISDEYGNNRVTEAEIETEFVEFEDKFGQKNTRPQKSIFKITDEKGIHYHIESERRTSIDLPVPVPSKVKTVISEQIHQFSLEKSKGNGISEYLYKL